jgi:hypothetical protein
MANTLTALQPVAYSAAKQVAAEPTAALGAINMSFDDKGVARGDKVRVPVAPTRAGADFTPGATNPEGADAIASNIEVEITKSRKVSWNLTGEQLQSLQNGTTDQEWIRQLLAQGMRTLRNEAEIDCVAAIRRGASRAFGTAGTTPFASDLSMLTNLRKILQDNGAPLADLQYVCDTNAGLNLRNLGVLQNAYQAGSEEERRSGRFLPQMGFAIRESAGISTVTKGTGSGYLVNMAGGLAVGGTDVTVDTGTGTILAGDIVTFAGTSAHRYVVNSALASNVFRIGAPGSRVLEADNDAITVGNDFTPSLAFERSAVVGIMRPPIFPENATIQKILVSDQSGLTYLLAQLDQYGQTSWELHLAWGFQSVNPEFIAVGLG